MMEIRIAVEKTKKEESDRILKSLQEVSSYQFCPLIKGTCNPKCVCFYKGEIMDNKNNSITFPMCTHPMTENKRTLISDN